MVPFIKHQPSLANGIKDLELEFNRFIFNYLDSKLGEDWFDDNQYYSDNKSRDRYKGSAKKKGLYIWEVMNFNSVVQEIVARNNLWDQYFGEMFSQYGIKSQEELRVFATKIWDYRSNEIGHARQTVLVYSKDELNMFQSIYRIFKKLITQEERQLQKEKQ